MSKVLVGFIYSTRRLGQFPLMAKTAQNSLIFPPRYGRVAKTAHYSLRRHLHPPDHLPIPKWRKSRIVTACLLRHQCPSHPGPHAALPWLRAWEVGFGWKFRFRARRCRGESRRAFERDLCHHAGGLVPSRPKRSTELLCEKVLDRNRSIVVRCSAQNGAQMASSRAMTTPHGTAGQ